MIIIIGRALSKSKIIIPVSLKRVTVNLLSDILFASESFFHEAGQRDDCLKVLNLMST